MSETELAKWRSLRPEVQAFALVMEERLKANNHKGGWKQCDGSWLLSRAFLECIELEDAVRNGEGDVLQEAADVANILMMIADVCGVLKRETIIKSKPILDACCGSRQFWFNKQNSNVEFCDNRIVPYHEYYPKRYIEIKPTTLCDFTALPYADKEYKLVVFDPPYLKRAASSSWLALKYGKLESNWPQMIHDGFWECMRILDDYGILIFKWSEVQIPLRDVLKAIGAEPLFGNRSGKHNNTHWMTFMKMPVQQESMPSAMSASHKE
jgi:NTP pyrophosphatase (non-canonical NTP hydrolase)